MYYTLKVEFEDSVRRDLVPKIHDIVIYIYFLLWFFIQPEDGFYSRNMLLMITYKQSCV